jgi:hypothetical protein
MNRIVALPAYSCADARIITKRPHSFQIVKISHFGTEYVHDYVVSVDEHPVSSRKSFDSNVPSKSLFDLVGKLNGHRRNLSRRAARGDHHMIGDARFSSERNGHDLQGLVVIERLKNELVEIFDIDGSAAAFSGAGTFNWMFGQGVSWRRLAGRDGARAEPRAAIGDTSGGFAREWRLRRSDRAAGEGK